MRNLPSRFSGILGRRSTVLVIALLAQLTVSLVTLSRGAEQSSDTQSYERSVPALLTSGSFDRSPGCPEIFRTPGYPLLLAGLHALFGEGSQGVVLLQAGLRVALVWAVCLIASEAFGQAAGNMAGILIALSPPSLLAAALVEPETLFTLFLTLALWACVRAAAPGAPLGAAAGCALLIAFATLVRPISYYLVPLLAVWLFTRHRRSALVYLAIVALILGGWQWRNARRAGVWTFSTVGVANLYYYRALGVLAAQQHRPIEEMQRELGYLHVAEADRPTIQRWSRDAIAVLLRSPGTALKTQLSGAARMLFGPGVQSARDTLGGRLAQPTLPFAVLQLAALYTGLLLTAWKARSSLKWTLVPYAIAAVYLVLVSSGPESYSRFRVPVEPLLAIFAAPGLLAIRGARKEPRCRHRLWSDPSANENPYVRDRHSALTRPDSAGNENQRTLCSPQRIERFGHQIVRRLRRRQQLDRLDPPIGNGAAPDVHWNVDQHRTRPAGHRGHPGPFENL